MTNDRSDNARWMLIDERCKHKPFDSGNICIHCNGAIELVEIIADDDVRAGNEEKTAAQNYADGYRQAVGDLQNATHKPLETDGLAEFHEQWCPNNDYGCLGGCEFEAAINALGRKLAQADTELDERLTGPNSALGALIVELREEGNKIGIGAGDTARNGTKLQVANRIEAALNRGPAETVCECDCGHIKRTHQKVPNHTICLASIGRDMGGKRYCKCKKFQPVDDSEADNG